MYLKKILLLGGGSSEDIHLKLYLYISIYTYGSAQSNSCFVYCSFIPQTEV